GGDTQARSFGVLKKGGVLVSIVGRPAEEKAKEAGVRGAGMLVHVDAGDLAQIAELIDEGKIKPVVTTVLPLPQAAKAHEMSETRHTRGKIVLETMSLSMPDPLVLGDGTKIAAPAQWEKRREEMKGIIEQHLTGHAPPPPGNVSGEVLDEQKLLDGAVDFRRVRLSFGADKKLGFQVGIFVPAKGQAPFATIVHLSFYATPGTPPIFPPAPASTRNAATSRAVTTAAATQAAERRKMFFSMS